MPTRREPPRERVFFVRGTRMYPVGVEGPGAPFDEASAKEGPSLLEAGWTVTHVVQSGAGALVVLRAGGPSQRLFFVHGVTAAPVEAPPDEPEHVPDYALMSQLLEQGGSVVASVPSGTGAVFVVRTGASRFLRARRRTHQEES